MKHNTLQTYYLYVSLTIAILTSNFALQAQSSATYSGNFINITLEQAIEDWKKKYHLLFAYDHQLVSNIYINQRIEATTLQEAMTKLLSNTDLSFRLLETSRILIYPATLAKVSTPEYITIEGKILDINTSEPLAFANIFTSTGQGTSSNSNGYFSLRLPSDEKMIIKVQYIGYESKEFKVSNMTQLPLQIALQAQPYQMASAVVLDKLPDISNQAIPQATTIQSSLLQKLPTLGIGTDLFRSLQLLPGIASFDDGNSGVGIRGSSDAENLIILDGITLLKADHGFGLFSAINANTVDKVNIYKNAFPAEYGGRTAGILDIHTKTTASTNSQWHGSLELNLLTADATLSMPIGKKMSAFLAARTTTHEIGEEDFFNILAAEDAARVENLKLIRDSTIQFLPLINKQQPRLKFNDIIGKWMWQPDAAHQLQFTYFGSRDHFLLSYTDEFTIRMMQENINNQLVYREKSSWTNQGASLQWHANWQEHFQSKVVLNWSEIESESALASSLSQSNRGIAIEVDNTGYNFDSNTAINWKNTWQISPNQTFYLGYNGIAHRLLLDLDVDRQRSLELNTEAYEHAIFSEYNHQLSQKWNVNMGLRTTYYSNNSKFYFSPRFQTTYQIKEAWNLKASASRYDQFLRETYHEDRFGRKLSYYVLAGDQFPVLTANQFMIGMNYLGKHFELDIELYDKPMQGITEYAHRKPGFDIEATEPNRSLDYKIFVGSGRTQGMDLMLRKHSGAYQGWIAYTLSKSVNQFAEINGNQPYLAPNDRRHQLKFVNLYERGRWNFSGTYIFATGKNYLDVSLLNTINRNSLPFDNFIKRTNDYHRLDVSAHYQLPVRSTLLDFSVSIFNLSDADNVVYRQFIYAIPQRNENGFKILNRPIGNDIELLDRTFNASIKWKF